MDIQRLPLLLAATLLSQVVWATPITLSSSSFSVTYDNSLTGAFGTPTLAGNTLFFTPSTFKTQSLSASSPSSFSQTLNLTITPLSGFKLGTLSLDEKGDYTLFGLGSSVNVGGQMLAENSSDAFQSINALISPISALDLIGGGNHNWEATSLLSFDNTWAGVDSITLSLTNSLSAAAGTASGPKLAFIEKKFVGLTIDTQSAPSQIPEPNTLSLFALGFVLLSFGMRKNFTGVLN
jgi:hypothetical protein